MRKQNKHFINATAFAIAAALILPAAPAIGADLVTNADQTEAAIEALSSNTEAGPIAVAEKFEVSEDGALSHSAPGAEISIAAANEPEIVLDSEAYEPLIISNALPGAVEVADGGTAVFESPDSYAVTPLPHDDGSIQIVTVLDNQAAPERFEYDLASSSDVSLQVEENGMVVIFDTSGAYVGGVGVPWAFDASGKSVPTHFEVNGSLLTQVVEHKQDNFTYPISADPYAGQNLWSWSSTDSYNNDTRVNLRLSSWGQGNSLPWILIDHGWPEALNRSSAIRIALNSKATMRQQFDCHAFGSAFAGDWNLERFRPNRTAVWSYGVAIHHCNWTTPDQY